MYHQSRKRTRHEDGEVVVEDQDVVFTERRVTWPATSGAVQDVNKLAVQVDPKVEVEADPGVEVQVEID